MKKNVKVAVAIVILIIIAAIAGVFLFKGNAFKPDASNNKKMAKELKFPKIPMSVYFLKNDAQKNPQFVEMKTQAPIPESARTSYSLLLLFSGAQGIEQKEGVYSEIPYTARIISIENKGKYFVADFSKEFEEGGGAASMQTRLNQVIKTVEENASMPVYITIEGHAKKAFGGEGVEINQPIMPKKYAKK